MINTLSYFGLSRPHDFNRAIPFFLSCLGLLVVASLTLYYAAVGALGLYTDRAFFLCYLAALFVCAVALLRFKIISWVLLAVALIELFLSLGTHFGNKIGIPIPSLLPKQVATQATSRFEYHPILMAVPRANFVSETGLLVKHNSKKLRGKEIVVGQKQKLINVYGGSSTYDIGVPDGSTWPEQLEVNLGNDWVVANYGVPGYSSSESLIQTAFYFDSSGFAPTCSVYYLGWNDIRNAHIPDLDSAFADFHLLSQIDNLQVRRQLGGFSPLYRIAIFPILRSFDTVPYPPNYQALGTVEGSDPILEKFYRRNMKMIYLMNASHGIKTVFVGQILNRNQLTSENRYGWLPRIKDKDVWPLQEHFNLILKDEADKLGAQSIVLAIDSFSDSDFIDNGHFSETGSTKFAKLIAADVKSACRQ